MPDKTIESRTADVLLQRPRTYTIGGTTYEVPAPTVATLVLVSEAISRMPSIPATKSKLTAALRYGRDARPLGEVVATLVLGARGVRNTVVRRHPVFFWRKETVEVDMVAPLADKLMLDLSPSEMARIVTETLTDMQLTDFFDLTTFLTGINMTRPTKVEGQTQSGPQ